jgi:hypothetical protein
MYQIHKFLPGLGLVECTAEFTGGGNGILFFYSPHLHAHVASLDNYHNT